MNQLETYSCKPVIAGCNDHINHLTFDGCAYFCTIECECEIIKLKKCLELEEKYCTCKIYDCICYDWREHCFWASSKTCFDTVFKLDCNMNEIDCIHIREVQAESVITGISYNCCNDTLMVSFTDTIIQVDKQCETCETIFSIENGWITAVLNLSPEIIITVTRDQKQYIEIHSHCGEKTACFCLDDKFTVKNLIFNPCQPHCMCPQIEAFILKNYCYPFLCELQIPFEALGFIPDRCNFEICGECCCEQPCKKDDLCTDIMESIAHIEAAISHILNAEGEKLQKIIAETDDIETILRVNREVNKTIIDATHLEHVLYAKLAALSDIDLCENSCDLYLKKL